MKQSPGVGFEGAGPARLEMARADWLARCAGDLVAKFDRSSGRDHQKLVSLLINHEMALRGAERNVRWARLAATEEAKSRIDQNLDRIRLARTTRDDTMQRAGLEEDLASARSYLGEARANLIRPMGGVPEPSEPDRIRLFGQPTSMIGIMPGIEETRSEVPLTLERPQWDASARITAVSIGGRDPYRRGCLARRLVYRPTDLAELACARRGSRTGRLHRRTTDPGRWNWAGGRGLGYESPMNRKSR